ncbi:hypothetical protein [Hyperthermus butylicus]|uniref:hypothetical protein n=1 Tax=Hyperthermus butylicus TaxID=54248 RepID=UPI001891217D|nr:hypothetical protein [Hyperthermus butylicus]
MSKLLSVSREAGFEERVRRFLELAIRRYNRYRGVESTAKLLEVKGDVAYVVFEGSFCETCGINDWVDDLKYVIEDLGGEAELIAVVEPPSRDEFFDYRIGVFKIRKVPENLDELEREEEELEKYFSHQNEEAAQRV